MAGSAVELDFFRIEKENSAKPQPNKLFDRRRSFRDIQGVISKLNPELLKTVIASGSVNQSFSILKSAGSADLFAAKTPISVPSTPQHDENPFSCLPVYTPPFRSESSPETAPLTIFYNGTVSVFNVAPNKAQNILKFAEGLVSGSVESVDPKVSAPTTTDQLLESLNGDLPLFRRKSLHRFLKKRKERLTLASPYGGPADYEFSGKKTSAQRV